MDIIRHISTLRCHLWTLCKNKKREQAEFDLYQPVKIWISKQQHYYQVLGQKVRAEPTPDTHSQKPLLSQRHVCMVHIEHYYLLFT